MNTNHPDLKKLGALSLGCTALIIRINTLFPPIDLFACAQAPNLDEVSLIVEDTRSKTQEVLQLEADLDNKQEQYRELYGKTINNATWEGYIEAGRTASIFIDHQCLWVDDDQKKIDKLEKTNIGSWVVILPGQRQCLADLGRAVTSERMRDLAVKFGAKHCVTITDWRFYDAESGAELPDDFDTELIASTSAKVEWRLAINEDGSTEFDFSPNFGGFIPQAS